MLNSNMFQPSDYGLYFYIISTTSESKVQVNVPQVAYADYSGFILGRTGSLSINADFTIKTGGNGSIIKTSCNDDNNPSFVFDVSGNTSTLNTGTYATLLFVYFSTNIHSSLEFETVQ